MFVIVPERKKDLIYRENLLDKVFGLDRHNLTTYKLRIDVDPVSDLSFSALYNDTFQGSLRFYKKYIISGKIFTYYNFYPLLI